MSFLRQNSGPVPWKSFMTDELSTHWYLYFKLQTKLISVRKWCLKKIGTIYYLVCFTITQIKFFFKLFLSIAILQQQAFAKLQEYKEYTAYNIQWVIENHPLIKVDVNLSSNIIIVPMSGIYTENCQCSIVSLGKKQKSRQIVGNDKNFVK